MKIGAKILDTLDEAIRLRDKVLLVLSEASIASDWVEDEVTKTFAEERQRGGVVLFPVRLDEAVSPPRKPAQASCATTVTSVTFELGKSTTPIRGLSRGCCATSALKRPMLPRHRSRKSRRRYGKPSPPQTGVALQGDAST
jgi:hypothetical protein